MSESKICASRTCKKIFMPHGNRRKYCSLACSKNENQRKYAEAHPEKVRQSVRRWEAEHRGERRTYNREKQRQWRAANLEKERERGREYARKWRSENHDKFIAAQRKRQATKHDILLADRRIREGHIPRAEYLKLVSRKTRVLTVHKDGRPATRATIFAEAHKLRQTGLPWSKIARQLLLTEYRQDPEATLDRLKKGVRYHTKQM